MLTSVIFTHSKNRNKSPRFKTRENDCLRTKIELCRDGAIKKMHLEHFTEKNDNW